MAISIENQASVSTTGATTFNLSFTVASANKIVVVVGTGNSSNRTPTSVTYAGDALTKCAESDDGNFENSTIWYRDNPTAGTANVAVTWSTFINHIGIAATGLLGAATGAPVSVQQALTGTTANPSLTLTATEAGDICIGGYASDLGDGGTTTAGGHSFLDAEDLQNDTDISAQDVTASGTSTALSWTAIAVASGEWAICGAAFRAEAAAVTGPYPRRLLTRATRQPSGPGTIDRNHPIARDLAFAIHFGQGGMINVVGRPGNQADTGTTTRGGAVDKRGFPVSGITGAGAAARSVAAASTMLFTTGPVTHMGLVRLSSVASPFGTVMAVSDGAFNQCFSLTRNNIGGAGTGPEFGIFRGNNRNFVTSGGAIAALADLNVHLWTATSTAEVSGTNNLWVDRTKFTAAADSTVVATLPTVSTARFLAARNLGIFATGSYFLHYCWPRILADWEILAMSENPWQLFQAAALQWNWGDVLVGANVFNPLTGRGGGAAQPLAVN